MVARAASHPWATAGALPAIAVAVACAVSAAPPPAHGRDISGSVTFSEEVVVPRGETWRVRPGTTIRFRGGKWTVRGKLVVAGETDRPVRIAGDEAFEGLDIRGGDGTAIENAVVTGGRRGVQVTNADVTFRRVRWEKNGIGLDVGQYAHARVADCSFVSPLRVGALVRRGGTARFEGSRFEGAGKAGLYVSGAKDVFVTDCRFERNAVGVQASMSGARASVAQSVFRENATGLLIERMAEPEITGCDIVANRVGMHFARRAEGRVSSSRIADNGDGVLVEFSSYPVFRGNRFRGNREAAVRLRNQSADWEEELGDSGRDAGDGGGAAPFGVSPGGRGAFDPGRGAQAPDRAAAPPAGGPAPRGGGAAARGGPPGRKSGVAGTVDFRENDWGEPGPDAAADGTPSAIHDGRDEPTFEYKGKSYRMDRVLLR